ncbi:MAG: RpiR family transcriptional regulator, partial [Mesorhizobium sp.]
MTEAEGHVRLTSGDEADRRDHVRRIPDIISLVKDSYSELRPAERRVADAV